jgi:ParB family transcriptional regulator, chromosome partitioning protein
MQVSVASITVPHRVRQEIGDLKPLVESMRCYGQLNPITITRTHELIAGHRRLLAARELGWQSIDAVCVDRDSPLERLEMELAENVARKDFTAAEIVAGYAELERLRKPRLHRRVGRFFQRLWSAFRGAFRRTPARPDDTAGVPDTYGA